MRYTRTFVILMFAAMLLVLGLLVASVTSCAPAPQQQEITAVQTIQDGTLHHPIAIDPSVLGTNNQMWHVATIDGSHQNWLVRPSALNPGQYILYSQSLYRITALNRTAFTMTVWGPLTCCAQG